MDPEGQRVIENVAVAIQSPGPEDLLRRGIWAQKPTQFRIVQPTAHVDEPELWVVLVPGEPRGYASRSAEVFDRPEMGSKVCRWSWLPL